MERYIIIETLRNDTKLMNKLIDLVEFEKNKHSIHDTDRPCYQGDTYDQCDDCYSGDTEFEHQEEARSFFSELAERIQSYYEGDKEDEEDSADEEEEEDGEGENEYDETEDLKRLREQIRAIKEEQELYNQK